KATRTDPNAGFALGPALASLGHPRAAGDWVGLVGLVAVGILSALFTAAVAAARHGGREPGLEDDESSRCRSCKAAAAAVSDGSSSSARESALMASPSLPWCS